MNVHKVVLTIIDFDDVGADEIKSVIEDEHYPNRCISPKVVDIETVNIGEWDDDNPLNNIKTSDSEWHRLFPSMPIK